MNTPLMLMAAVNAVWAYNPRTQQFLSYDNAQLVSEKATYVNSNNLGGLMTWLISEDAPAASRDLLLRAAIQVLGKTISN